MKQDRFDRMENRAPIPAARVYESIIKVFVADPPATRIRDITEGLGYACALLMDEYGMTADAIEGVLERIIDDVRDQEQMRA